MIYVHNSTVDGNVVNEIMNNKSMAIGFLRLQIDDTENNIRKTTIIYLTQTKPRYFGNDVDLPLHLHYITYTYF